LTVDLAMFDVRQHRFVEHCRFHPSGDPTPSPEDVKLTYQLVQLGKELDIDVIDHLIIGRGRWVSLRSKGLGFSKGRT